MKISIRYVFLGLLITIGSSAVLLADPSSAYHVIKKIPIPGEGGWDYLTMDSGSRRLYISHSTHVDILDVDQEKLIGQIPNTAGVHGISLAPELGRGFTSNGKDGTVTVFDLNTFKVLDHIKVDGQNPDAILFDPATRRIFTFNGHSSDATAIDAAAGKIVGHVALGGGPEFAVTDGKGMIYDNLEQRSQTIAFDSKNLTVKQRWPVAPCEEPSSMAMDRANHRLFLGCGNHLMAVLDANSGRVIATLPIGDHVDATVFDAEKGLVFNACGDGTLTVIHEDSPNTYHVVETVSTQKGARTVALDEKTHQLYLASAQFGPTPAPTVEKPHPWPMILPGTFVILVVGQ